MRAFWPAIALITFDWQVKPSAVIALLQWPKQQLICPDLGVLSTPLLHVPFLTTEFVAMILRAFFAPADFSVF